MRPDPPEHYWVVVAAWRRLKYCRVNHGRNDPGARSLPLNVFGNRAVAAGDYAGPSYQVVSFANTFHCPSKLSIRRASIGNVSSIIQIEDHRTFEESHGHPFNQRRTKDHCLTLDKHRVRLTKQQ